VVKALLLTLLLIGGRQAAAAESYVFVEKDVAWKKAAAGESAAATLLILDREHDLIAVETTLKRPAAGKPETPDLDGGYRLYCGRWTAPSLSEIVARAALLESYRYPAFAEKKQFAATFRASGEDWGPVHRTLADGSRVFESLPTLRFGETEVARFRLACSGVK
jgi:hypothetical protein